MSLGVDHVREGTEEGVVQRLRERGAGALEWLGVVVVATLVVGILAMASPSFGSQLAGAFERATCAVSSSLGGSISCGTSTPDGDTEAPYAEREWTYADATGGQHVHLGDSFASGEGTFNYEDGTDERRRWPWQDKSEENTCHRGVDGWGNQVGGTHMPGRTINVSCSGAKTGEYYDPHEGNNGQDAQSLALTPETTLVTLSLGGNDVGFADIVMDCLLPFKCRSDWGTPSEDYGGATQFEYALDQTMVDLSALYDDIIRKTEGNAHVVVMGYPPLWDEGDDGWFGQHGNDPLFAPKDMEWMNDRAADINAALKQLAEEKGFHFIDPTEAFEGHGVGSDDPWILAFGWGKHRAGKPETYHPTQDGADAMAQLVNDYLDSLP